MIETKDTIELRAFGKNDAKFINDLRKEEEIESMICGQKRPISYDRELKWVEDIIMNDDQTKIYFAITIKGNDDIIGYTSISDIDYRNGSCFWSGIKIAKKHNGKGIGKQTAIKIVNFIFNELRMERCKAECLENHEIALKMMISIGYKQEGLMRHSIFKNGKYNNQWLLSIIKEDWQCLFKN